MSIIWQRISEMRAECDPFVIRGTLTLVKFLGIYVPVSWFVHQRVKQKSVPIARKKVDERRMYETDMLSATFHFCLLCSIQAR